MSGSERLDRLPVRRAGRVAARCRNRRKGAGGSSADGSEVDDGASFASSSIEEEGEVRKVTSDRDGSEAEDNWIMSFMSQTLLGGEHCRIEEYWNDYAKSDVPGFFTGKNLRVAADGGLADIPRLLYPGQYWKMCMGVGCAVWNGCTILRQDWKVISSHETEKHLSGKFLVSKCVISWLDEVLHTGMTEKNVDMLDRLVPMAEATCLVLMILQMLWFIVVIAGSSVFKRDQGDMVRWMYTASLFWSSWPQVQYFSAMQLLYFITPAVMGMQAYHTALHAKQRWQISQGNLRLQISAVWLLIHYVLTRLFYALIGFDAFLVKFRMVIKAIDRGDEEGGMRFVDIQAAFFFLVQMMGVLNVTWFVRERLFVFIFGGQDGQLDEDEEVLADVWAATMAKSIYAHYGFWKGTIVMFGYDDYDFQRLALDDDEEEIRIEEKAKLSEELRNISSDDVVTRLSSMELLKLGSAKGASGAYSMPPMPLASKSSKDV